MTFLFCGSILALLPKHASSEYIEGVDTTDVNGYGLDSAFQVSGDGRIVTFTPNFASYAWNWGESGFFNYSFEDIKIAANLGPLSATILCLR